MEASPSNRNEKTKKIWVEFSNQLKAFIFRKVIDASVVDDILQDVFIKIHSNVHNLKEEQKIRGWIYQIARNSIIDYYRKRKIDQQGLDDSYGYEMMTDVDPDQEIASGLEDMVKELPPIYAEALLLTEFKGLKQKELANKIGLSISAVKNRVQRARQLIKDDLMRCCHFEFDKYGTIIDYHPITCCCCHQYIENNPN
ncbi:MAG: RNA polymerase sigma factor SigZ [Ignavibacterium sp.]|nr:MAG: RNA polymerase sigma factor SigZ [Ignavibacterium sp.]